MVFSLRRPGWSRTADGGEELHRSYRAERVRYEATESALVPVRGLKRHRGQGGRA